MFFRTGQLYQSVSKRSVSVLLYCKMCVAKLTLPREGDQFFHSRFGRLLNAFHLPNWLTLPVSSDKSWAPLVPDQTNLMHKKNVSSHLASFSCFVSQFFSFLWMNPSLRQTTESSLMNVWGPKHLLNSISIIDSNHCSFTMVINKFYSFVAGMDKAPTY